MRAKHWYLRTFHCPDCGQVLTASKNKPTPVGHIKTMYCPVCRAERDFEQTELERVKKR